MLKKRISFCQYLNGKKELLYTGKDNVGLEEGSGVFGLK
jgi:hypothetical protein